jgi:hypothetical protein
MLLPTFGNTFSAHMLPSNHAANPGFKPSPRVHSTKSLP